ncbi:MAG: 50S ribosomal protein L9 [Candidatus Aminicenantes bacterium RBG_13_63_10]|nr:MAG: 50S ribosomal protein L9 [Candidatus Aminicenantes bacterium RBG_13_63_10]
MKVILKSDVENLGRKGDIVNVSSGYGRNFLLPRKLALEVTPTNMKMIEIERQALTKRQEKEKQSHQDLIQRLNAATLTFRRKTGEKDHIFGSVSAADIREALAGLGLDIDKKKIILDEPLRRLGNYSVPVRVFQDEKAEVKVEIVQAEEETPQES